ncbi:MAG: hypothetical protein DMF59_18650, partial [Acidobacteria bacterium]
MLNAAVGSWQRVASSLTCGGVSRAKQSARYASAAVTKPDRSTVLAGTASYSGGSLTEAGGLTFGCPCTAHDKCYSTCGASKGDCDRKFLEDVRAVCNGKRKSLFFLKYRCLDRANLYYSEVTKYG